MNKRRNLLAGMFTQAAIAEDGTDGRAPAVLPSSLGAMRTSLRELSDEAGRARRLEEQIEAGDRIVNIDPSLVDPSFIRDRIPVEHDPDFAAFVESMKDGQQVPILVRPHPDESGRYQAAFGHRRLKAAQSLGRPVRAVVRNLTDAELVIAQGKENSERRDLSFIERALFASLLEERGFDRPTIQSALGVDKGDLSRLLGVAKAIPAAVILSIGPAPKVGRPRWLQLVEAMQRPGASKAVQKAIANDAFVSAETNARVDILIRALRSPQEARLTELCTTPDGRAIARVERSARSVRLSIDDLAFGSFLANALGRLHAEFLANPEAKKSQEGGASRTST